MGPEYQIISVEINPLNGAGSNFGKTNSFSDGQKVAEIGKAADVYQTATVKKQPYQLDTPILGAL